MVLSGLKLPEESERGVKISEKMAENAFCEAGKLQVKVNNRFGWATVILRR